MKNFIPLIFLLTLAGEHASSQTDQHCVINTSGGSFANESYSYEWSIGELVLVNEMVANDGKYILTNGFLQPFPRNGNPAIPPASFKDHEIRLLKNPVKDVLGVQLVSNETGRLKLWVYDERGYIKYFKEINTMGAGLTEFINMINYANGNYMLKAEFNGDGQTKTQKARTYKFIKIY